MRSSQPERARTFRILVAFAIAALLVVAPQIAQATWRSQTPEVTVIVGTAMLAAPVLDTTTVNCPDPQTAGTATIVFEPVTRAEGYTATVTGGASATVAPAAPDSTTRSVDVSLPMTSSGTWTVSIVAQVHGWTSPPLTHSITCPAT